jgi:TatD DNase family protein
MTTAPLVDIGINLGHESFDPDRDAVMDAAWQAGLVAMVLTGTSEQASIRAAELAATHPRLFSTAGVHPHDAAGFSDTTASTLRELLNLDQVVAVGETGLDYYRDFSPRPAQQEAFGAQLELAVATGLPVFMHQRDAHSDFYPILKEFRDRLSRGVVHCFTGTRKELYDYLDLDMHIGITGWICDERRGLHLQELVHDIPANRLLLETDGPYLMPRNIRPKPKTRRNDPANLVWVLDMVALCLGQAREDIAHQTTINAGDFFGIPSLL